MTLGRPQTPSASDPLPREQPIVLNYDLTEEERMASLAHLGRRLPLRVIWYVLTGLAMVGMIFTDLPDDPVLFRLLLGILGGTFVIVGLALPHLRRDRIQKVLAQTPDSGLARVTFDQTGMRDET